MRKDLVPDDSTIWMKDVKLMYICVCVCVDHNQKETWFYLKGIYTTYEMPACSIPLGGRYQINQLWKILKSFWNRFEINLNHF